VIAGEDLPAVNAVMNGAATVLLVCGYAAIRSGRRETHARLMVAAFGASILFLAGYLTYHFGVQAEMGPTKFNRTGWVHTAYLVMLASHVVLAAVNLPMVLRTLWLAHRGDLARHKAWARWTFPIWLYVSVTGVLVYLCLYVWNPPLPGAV
jgi:uncharacterized membrane protein YozB (DUF420 family)